MIALEDVLARIQGSALVLGIDTVPKGHIRLETSLVYPGGDSVDIFIRCDRETLTLSDLGQTAIMAGSHTLEMELDSLDGLLAGIDELGREAVRIAGGSGP